MPEVEVLSPPAPNSTELARRRQTERLGTDPVGPLVVRLSLPAMVGLLMSSLYVFVDRIFVGNYCGEIGLAAMSVAIPFSTFVFAFSILVGRGCSVMYSIALGRHDYNEAGKVFSGGIMLNLIMSLAIMAVGYAFLEPILFYLGATQTSIGQAKEYVGVTLIGTPFAMVTMHNHLIRSEGASTYAMVTQIAGALLNVALDWLFMAIFGWGMRGAAFATVISQAFSVVMVMWFFAHSSVIRFRLHDMLIERRLALGIVYNGLTPFIFNFAAMLAGAIQNSMIKRYTGPSGFGTDTAMAAFGISMSLRHLIMTPAFGLSMGMQPIVGYNIGAQKLARARKSFVFSVVGSILLVMIPYLMIQVLSRHFVWAFGARGEALELGVYTMRRHMVFVPFGCLVALFSHYFQGAGKPRQALTITAFRQVILALPLILLLPGAWGYDGIIFSTPLAELGGFFFGLIMIQIEFRRLRRQEAELDALAATADAAGKASCATIPPNGSNGVEDAV